MADRLLINFWRKDTEAAIQDMVHTLGLMRRSATLACSRALNRTIVTSRGQLMAEVREEYNVPARELRNKMIIRRATTTNLRAFIMADGEVSIPLIRFGARPNKPVSEGARRPAAGPSVHIKKVDGRKVVSGAFIQRRGNGMAQMYKRLGRSRLPIVPLFGPGFVHVLRDESSWDERQEVAVTAFQKNLRQEAEHVLQQAGLR